MRFNLSFRLLVSLFLIAAFGEQAARAHSPAVAADFRGAQTEYGRPNVVKLNGFMLVHGYICVAYERMLLKRLSMEVGGGPTYKDHFYHYGLGRINPSDFFDDSDYGQFLESSQGYGAYAAVKYYLGSMRMIEPNGPYLALQFQQREHRWTQYFGYGGQNQVSQVRKLTDIVPMFGYQGILDDNISMGVNFGLGIRNQSYNRKKIEDSGALADAPPSSTGVMLAFNLKFGYAF